MKLIIYNLKGIRPILFFCLLTLFWGNTLLYTESRDPDESVTIYDDFDDGRFGRSEYRSILRTVKLSAFERSVTLPVYSPAMEEKSYLTAVVVSADRYGKMQALADESGIIEFRQNGLVFSYSLEKAEESLLAVLKEYYSGPWADWYQSVRDHYLENYVIRIHSAENIFEPWNNTISYSEALLMATLVGDWDQWLWGIHDGLNLEIP